MSQQFRPPSSDQDDELAALLGLAPVTPTSNDTPSAEPMSWMPTPAVDDALPSSILDPDTLSGPAPIEPMWANDLAPELSAPPEQVPSPGPTRAPKRRKAPTAPTRGSSRLSDKKKGKIEPNAVTGWTAIQTGQFHQGRNGRSPIGAASAATEDVIRSAKRRPVTGGKGLFLNDQLGKATKAQGQGRSYVSTERDPTTQRARTFGTFEAPKGNHGREATPRALHLVGADESGHGFPQAYVNNPDAADQTQHMHAQSPLNNRGVTAALEREGARRAEQGGTIAKVLVALGPDRPEGFLEVLYEHLGEGEWDELVSVLATNPELLKVTEDDYTVQNELSLDELAKKYFPPDDDGGNNGASGATAV